MEDTTMSGPALSWEIARAEERMNHTTGGLATKLGRKQSSGAVLGEEYYRRRESGAFSKARTLPAIRKPDLSQTHPSAGGGHPQVPLSKRNSILLLREMTDLRRDSGGGGGDDDRAFYQRAPGLDARVFTPESHPNTQQPPRVDARRGPGCRGEAAVIQAKTSPAPAPGGAQRKPGKRPPRSDHSGKPPRRHKGVDGLFVAGAYGSNTKGALGRSIGGEKDRRFLTAGGGDVETFHSWYIKEKMRTMGEAAVAPSASGGAHGCKGTGRREHELSRRIVELEHMEAAGRGEILQERVCFSVFCRHAHPQRAGLRFDFDALRATAAGRGGNGAARAHEQQQQAQPQALTIDPTTPLHPHAHAHAQAQSYVQQGLPPPPPPLPADIDELDELGELDDDDDDDGDDEPRPQGVLSDDATPARSRSRLTPLPNAVVPSFGAPPPTGSTLCTPLPNPLLTTPSKRDVDICMDVMAQYGGDENVAYVSVGVLSAFARDVRTREWMAQRGGVDALLRCVELRRRNATLLLILMHAMEQMLATPATHTFFNKSNAIQPLLEALELYAANLPVAFATLACIHSLLAHTHSLPVVAHFLNAAQGLALLIDLTWQFSTSALFVCRSVGLLALLSKHGFTHQILLHGFDQAIPRMLCSLSKAVHPDNWRIRRQICRMFSNITAHKNQQRRGPTVDRVTDHGWPTFLLDVVLEGCTHARTASPSGASLQLTIKAVEHAVEALSHVSWNTNDKIARALTHAAPQVVKLAGGFSSKVIHTRAREILSRLGAADPYVTHTALQLCLHPILYADFRPPAMYALKDRVALAADGVHATFTATHGDSGEGLLVRCVFVQDSLEVVKAAQQQAHAQALAPRRRGKGGGGGSPRHPTAPFEEAADAARRKHYLQHPHVQRFTEEILKRCAVYHPNLVNYVSWSAKVCVPLGADYAGGVPDAGGGHDPAGGYATAHTHHLHPTTVFYMAYKLALGSVTLGEYLTAMAAALKLAAQRRKRLDSVCKLQPAQRAGTAGDDDVDVDIVDDAEDGGGSDASAFSESPGAEEVTVDGGAAGGGPASTSSAAAARPHAASNALAVVYEGAVGDGTDTDDNNNTDRAPELWLLLEVAAMYDTHVAEAEAAAPGAAATPSPDATTTIRLADVVAFHDAEGLRLFYLTKAVRALEGEACGDEDTAQGGADDGHQGDEEEDAEDLVLPHGGDGDDVDGGDTPVYTPVAEGEGAGMDAAACARPRAARSQSVVRFKVAERAADGRGREVIVAPEQIEGVPYDEDTSSHGAAHASTGTPVDEDTRAAAAVMIIEDDEEGYGRGRASEDNTADEGEGHAMVCEEQPPAAHAHVFSPATGGFRHTDAPHGLSYAAFFDIAYDIAKALRFLQLAGIPPTPVALDRVYRDDDQEEWKVLWDPPNFTHPVSTDSSAGSVDGWLHPPPKQHLGDGGSIDGDESIDLSEPADTPTPAPAPAQPQPQGTVTPAFSDMDEDELGEIQAGQVNGVKSLGYILVDLLFYSSASARFLFLKCGLAPGAVPALLLNALLAPCLGAVSFTNFHLLGVGGPGGIDPSSPSLAAPDAIARLVHDLKLLVTARSQYSTAASRAYCDNETMSDDLLPFCRWLADHAAAHPDVVFEALPVTRPEVLAQQLELWEVIDVLGIPCLTDVVPAL